MVASLIASGPLLAIAVAEDWYSFVDQTQRVSAAYTGLPEELGLTRMYSGRQRCTRAFVLCWTKNRVFVTAHSEVKKDEKENYKLIVIGLDRVRKTSLAARSASLETGPFADFKGRLHRSRHKTARMSTSSFRIWLISYDAAGKERGWLPLGPFNMFYGSGMPILVDEK